MSSLQQFFHMGGYAFYVWTAFGATLFVLGMNVFLALRRRRDILKHASHT